MFPSPHFTVTIVPAGVLESTKVAVKPDVVAVPAPLTTGVAGGGVLAFPECIAAAYVANVCFVKYGALFAVAEAPSDPPWH